MRYGRALLLALFGVVCVGGYFAYDRVTRAKQPVAVKTEQTVPVSVETAKMASFPVLLSGLGSVLPFNTVTVRSRVDGEIVNIAFKEGQTVQQGDLLAQIDPRPYQAAVDQARAKKSQDEATLKNAKLDLDRYTTLAKQDFASRQQLDTQTSAVAQGTSLVQADQAALDNAETQLSYTSIKAPITGRVGFRLVDQGNIVNASAQNGIVVITQVQPISVLFALPENQIDRINKALARGKVSVNAFTSDGSRKLADGTLAVINNQVDTTTGVIQLKATFENKDNALWPGQAVSAKVLVDTLDSVVVIPQAAVQHGQQGLWTYVVTGDKRVETRPLQLGETNNDSAVVLKGVSAGEQVVTGGQYRLQNGALIAANQNATTAANPGTGR
jgi:multidrug efflux system membrane fusion protein